MEDKNYTTIYRIMHWAIAISFLLLLITIFLRMTWLNKEHLSEIIKSYLITLNINLPDEQIVLLAKKIRKPMWMWHIYLGYFLVGLYIIRMSLVLLKKMSLPNPFAINLSLKERFQYSLYLAFYICVGASLVTGLIIEFGNKSWKNSAEEIHELSIYYLLTYIVLHISGVIIAEFTNQKGIVSKIISGK